MIVSIHQPQYLPWLGYFDKIIKSDVFVLLDDVQFKKNDWQNRNRIRTSQGWQWLTVPIIHNFGQNINETKINNTSNWRDEHLKALTINYSKAPYFKEHINLFKDAYSKDWTFLSDLNIYLIQEILQLLDIKTKIVKSSEYNIAQKSTMRLIDLCKIFSADAYIAGADGNKYMDTDIFKKNNIKIVTQEYIHPQYTQLYNNNEKTLFESNMAIVDLLFNCGKESKAIISS